MHLVNLCTQAVIPLAQYKMVSVFGIEMREVERVTEATKKKGASLLYVNVLQVQGTRLVWLEALFGMCTFVWARPARLLSTRCLQFTIYSLRVVRSTPSHTSYAPPATSMYDLAHWANCIIFIAGLALLVQQRLGPATTILPFSFSP